MTSPTLPLHQNEPQRISGLAILFFMLGAPNIYSALRSPVAPDAKGAGFGWLLGGGILTFVGAGAAICFTSLV